MIYELPTYHEKNDDGTHGPDYEPGKVLDIDGERWVVTGWEKTWRSDRTPEGWYRAIRIERLADPPQIESHMNFTLYERMNHYGEYSTRR